MAECHWNRSSALDSGCSVSVTPFKEDFPGGIKETEDAEMHGLRDVACQCQRRTLLNMLKTCDCDEGAIESWHPLALAAKANDADATNWNQAMNGPNAEGFWKACEKELDTLEKMGVWEVVKKQHWTIIESSKSINIGICCGLSFLGNAESPRIN